MSFYDDPSGIYVVACDHLECEQQIGCREPKAGQSLPPLPPDWKEVTGEHEGKTVKKHYCPKHEPPQQSL